MRIIALIIAVLVLFIHIKAEELPEDEIQVNFNSYFDNFQVNVIYPEISLKKSLSESTGLNIRYLVDVITSASMKSHFDSVYSRQNVIKSIDAYTSATTKNHGGGDNVPDELRHEIGIGITQFIGDATVSVNNLFSTEHDYTSETVAASVSMPFAQKNTVLNLGLVKSWDKVSPQIRKWSSDKDVYSVTLGLSQILSKKLLTQFEFFYSNLTGFLSDPYQVVTVVNYDNNYLRLFEPDYPDKRDRYAISARGIYGLTEMSSLLLGYRIYSDSWEINSHTVNALYQHQFHDEQITFGTGIRFYVQTPAYFFKKEYSSPEEYMSVDPKLNGLKSLELQFKTDFAGEIIPFINNEDVKLNIRLNYFWRETDSPDWHSKYRILHAYIFSIGVAYKI